MYAAVETKVHTLNYMMASLAAQVAWEELYLSARRPKTSRGEPKQRDKNGEIFFQSYEKNLCCMRTGFSNRNSWNFQIILRLPLELRVYDREAGGSKEKSNKLQFIASFGQGASGAKLQQTEVCWTLEN